MTRRARTATILQRFRPGTSYNPGVVSDTGRPRILWASPLPPARTGVADYAAELLPALAGRARIRVLPPPGWRPGRDWPPELEIAPADAEAAPGEIVLIHLGNNPHHLWLLPRLRAGNGVVVLHDAVLHHLLVEETVARGELEAYEEALMLAHGPFATAIAKARAIGHSGRLDAFLLPARAAFLQYCRGVITHSDWAASVISSECSSLPVARVPLAAADPGPVDRAAVRALLGIDADDLVLMHLGYLGPEKGLEEIVTAVAAAARIDPRVRLVVVGEGADDGVLESAAAAAGIADRLRTTGWVAPDRLLRVPAVAGLGVVLRTPSAGETSAAALRFLACGVPVAIGGRRQFLELDEAAAPRLTPGPSAAAELVRLLISAAAEDWSDRRAAARALYECGHRPDQVAVELVSAVKTMTANARP